MPTQAERMVHAWKAAGVTTIFGIPSIHNIGFYEALRKEPSIRHVLCRHESGATHMADGYARAGQGVGVVVTSTGPGAGYMVSPLIEAFWSSSPVLAVASNIKSSKIGRGIGTLHEFENQDAMFRTITKAVFLARSGDDLGLMTQRAVAAALSGRPGPVYLEVPVGVWDEAAGEGSEGGDFSGGTEAAGAEPKGLEAAVLLFQDLGFEGPTRSWLVLAMVIGLSFLMVSNVRYPSFKGELIKAKPFNALVVAVLILALISIRPQIVIFAVALMYVAWGPLLALYFARRAGEEPEDEDEAEAALF